MAPPLSDAELSHWAREHLVYEAKMLAYSAVELAKRRELPRDHESNVLLESFQPLFLLEARNASSEQSYIGEQSLTGPGRQCGCLRVYRALSGAAGRAGLPPHPGSIGIGPAAETICGCSSACGSRPI